MGVHHVHTTLNLKLSQTIKPPVLRPQFMTNAVIFQGRVYCIFHTLFFKVSLNSQVIKGSTVFEFEALLSTKATITTGMNQQHFWGTKGNPVSDFFCGILYY